MVDSIWPESNGDHAPLPTPNVVVARSGTPMHELSAAAIKGILVNPIYTGIGPFPRLVEDEAWVRAGAKLIDEEGAQQFLVNLLFVLRQCFPADSDRRKAMPESSQLLLFKPVTGRASWSPEPCRMPAAT
jgi:hypothetical protein